MDKRLVFRFLTLLWRNFIYKSTPLMIQIKHLQTILSIWLVLFSFFASYAQIADVMPEFPEGTKAFTRYLQKNLKYPKDARRQKIEGKVYVEFVVDKYGQIKNVRIIKGLFPSCDAEVLRIFEQMKQDIVWKPGKEKGRNVDVKMSVPIQFKLDKGADKNESDYIYDEDIEYERDVIGLQVSGNTNNFFELSLTSLIITKYLDQSMISGGATFGTEYNIEQGVFAPKFDISFRVSKKMGLQIKFDHLFHIQNKHLDYVFRPTLGLGHRWVFLDYGYNFFLSNKIKSVRHHQVSLSVVIPLFSAN